MLYIPFTRFVKFSICNNSKAGWLIFCSWFCAPLLIFNCYKFFIKQFKHVMVKEKEQVDNSSKLDKNGKGGASKKPKPVGAVETS